MRGKTYFLGFMLIFLLACAKESPWTYAPTPYSLKYPASFPIQNFDKDNPITIQGVELGRRLYYDSLLHPNGKMSCSGCHFQDKSFSSLPEVLPHVNLGWNTSFLWNGKVRGNIEDIMLFEVADFFKTDVNKLNQDKVYPKLFYEAFGIEKISSQEVSKALAQFVRTLISSDAPYDKITTQGSGLIFSDEELSGYEIFFTEKGDCFHCHGGILFTDNLFHNNGLDIQPSQNGLSETTGFSYDLGKFKTPTLRNIELTGPYMHDGRYLTLEEVIDFYSEGVKVSSTIDPLMKQAHRGGINLTAREKKELIAFLKTLTDQTFIKNPNFSNPF
ncbi:MAG: cytochrome c peroxidase [Saprospiraceae bacterium]